MSHKERKFFRIKYPREFRPELIIDGRTYKVVDVSEAGLKFIATGEYDPEVGRKIVATFGFKTGARITVKGEVVRRDAEDVMVRLNTLIGKEVLKAEAALLLERLGEVPTEFY